MRKIARTAIADLEAGRMSRQSQEGRSIWSDGTNLWSYETCILAFGAFDRPIINVTQYSRTTSDKQRALRVKYPAAILVSGLPFGAGPADLRQRSME